MKSVIESFEFLKGLPLAKWKIVKDYKDLSSCKFPCYLKADVSGHKTETKAVIRCSSLEDAEKKLLEMHKTFPNDRIIIQENFEGIEMIVGLKHDAAFGKILAVGFGGTFAEIKKDISFRALPISESDIIQMVKELDSFNVFKARGKKYNLTNFYTTVQKIAHLCEVKEIQEMDLNPIIIGETQTKIVDARIELK
mgnify:CR=1 FL=1